MNKFNMLIKLFALIAICSFASSSHAQFDQGKSAIEVAFGFTQGGMALGIDYEYAKDRTFGLGGYVRNYAKSDSSPRTDGLTTVGAFIRPHFNRQAWDFYLSPGFGMISYKPASNASTETLLGPSLALGLLYEFTSHVSFGVESMDLYSWFGEDDFRGHLSSELLAKFRFIF